MKRRLVLRVEEKPRAADRRGVHRRLRAFNEAKVGRPVSPREFSVFVRDTDGAIVGGLNALTYWDWLHVDHLWVDDGLRGHGWGRRLLAAAERIGRDRGCRGVWLDTMSFQAPGFYRHMGYREFGRLDEHPAGQSLHFFWKSLAVKAQPRARSRTPARRR